MGKKFRQKAKQTLLLALPAILLFNLFVAPFLSRTQPALYRGGEVSYTRSLPVGNISGGADIAVASAGILGLDTLWNGIKGFFQGVAQFTDGMTQIFSCVANWGKGGAILIAIISCPLLSFTGLLVNILAEVFNGIFEIRIFFDSDSGGARTVIHESYQRFLSVANIAFVIILLMVVLSMVTSVGISNYNIKKMAPRIIIVAIAMNLSFWLCAIAVDVSNIAGGQFRAFLNPSTSSINVSGESSEWESNSDLFGELNLAEGVTNTATFPSLLLIIMLTFVVITIMMLIAAIMVPILAVIRIMLCMACVIFAPLAIVCVLHPKTQQYFTKWFKAFGGLLIIFPAFGIILGLSDIARHMFVNMRLKNAADFNDPGLMIMQMVGAFVATAAPILFIKPVMKSCSTLMAKASAKVDGAIKTAGMVAVTAATMGAGAMAAGGAAMSNLGANAGRFAKLKAGVTGGAKGALKSSPIGKKLKPLTDAYTAKGNRDIEDQKDAKKAFAGIEDRVDKDYEQYRKNYLGPEGTEATKEDFIAKDMASIKSKEYMDAKSAAEKQTLASRFARSEAAEEVYVGGRAIKASKGGKLATIEAASRPGATSYEQKVGTGLVTQTFLEDLNGGKINEDAQVAFVKDDASNEEYQKVMKGGSAAIEAAKAASLKSLRETHGEQWLIDNGLQKETPLSKDTEAIIGALNNLQSKVDGQPQQPGPAPTRGGGLGSSRPSGGAGGRRRQ